MLIKFSLFLILLIFLPCKAEWIEYKPIRALGTTSCKRLNDVIGHTNNVFRDRDNNICTILYETVHSVNSDIRMKYPAGYNGFYCLEDKAYILKEPKGVTLRQVGNSIPQKYKGYSFNLYIQNQANNWNNQPLYILDELIAYNDDAIGGIENNIKDYNWDLTCSLELNIYAIFLDRLVKEKEIHTFIKFVTERNLLIYNQCKHSDQMDKQFNLLKEIYK